MKKNIQMVVTVALLIFAASCSLYEKVVDVPQQFSLDVASAACSSPQFEVSTTINTASEEIEKYKDDNVAFDVEKVSFTIEKVSFTVDGCKGKAASALAGNLMFAPAGTTAFKKLGAVSHANLSALAANGEEVSLALTNGTAKQELVNLLRTGSPVTFQLEGAAAGVPVAATLNFKVYATMTVEY